MSTQPEHEVVDLELTSFIHQSRQATSAGDTVINEWARGPVEEEYMAKMDEFMGDGTATVTVSGALAHNDFGNKAEAFVSVRLPCGATMEAVMGAHEIARGIVEEKCRENLDRMEEILGVPLSASGGEAGKVAAPSVETKLPTKATTPPKRKITIKKPGKKTPAGPKPPSFER